MPWGNINPRKLQTICTFLFHAHTLLFRGFWYQSFKHCKKSLKQSKNGYQVCCRSRRIKATPHSATISSHSRRWHWKVSKILCLFCFYYFFFIHTNADHLRASCINALSKASIRVSFVPPISSHPKWNMMPFAGGHRFLIHWNSQNFNSSHVIERRHVFVPRWSALSVMLTLGISSLMVLHQNGKDSA